MKFVLAVALFAFEGISGGAATVAEPLEGTRAPVVSRDTATPEDRAAEPAPDAPDDEDWTLLNVHDKDHPDLAENGHLIRPAGTSLRVGGRIMDMTLARGGKFLVVKADTRISVVDADTFKVVSQVPFPAEPDGRADRGSMHGIAVGPDGSTLWFSGNRRCLYPATLDAQGVLHFKTPILLGNRKVPVHPLGVAITPDGKRAVVALSRSNEVAVVDLRSRDVISRIPVGVCPYGVVLDRDGRHAYVSNFGGGRAREGDKTEMSAGTEVAVDERSVALRGSVTVIYLQTSTVVAEIPTEIHPEAMSLSADGGQLLVVDSSGDGISAINLTTRKVVTGLGTKPEADFPYGSLTTGVALGGNTVFAVNAGNNAVAMIDPAKPQAPFAFIAAGGFPGSICVRGDELFIGNVLGYQGNLQKVTVPADAAELTKLTEQAKLGFRFPEILRARMRAQSGVPPKPVPDQVGAPSPIKHVVYIIKENKKFDQVLGDIGRGNAEPKFCEFPRATTPNAHALVDEFMLLDNYYCSGVNSSDGHQWTVQGLTTPYREKDWSNGRSPYEFGLDPLSYASCGFIWDHLLRKGISFRNFGELGTVKVAGKPDWTGFYEPWSQHAEVPAYTTSYQIDTLRRYSDMRSPGWEMAIPDQIRADVFIKALGEFEQAGRMPEFVILYLPNDHTVGGRPGWPSPSACVADNDLALGRAIEALSNSSFWKDMAVFSLQDDPQTGVDHVDGHRSFCLIASPYAKRGGQVISRFYTQSSVLHTICRIFGVEPMNQLVAMAPVMSDCFQDQPDLTPFTCQPESVALNESNPDPKKAPSKAQAQLAPRTYDLDFSQPDLIDEHALVFSEWVWSTVHGDEPFPTAYFGAHGKGLAALGLRLDASAEIDDDD